MVLAGLRRPRLATPLLTARRIAIRHRRRRRRCAGIHQSPTRRQRPDRTRSSLQGNLFLHPFISSRLFDEKMVSRCVDAVVLVSGTDWTNGQDDGTVSTHGR